MEVLQLKNIGFTYPDTSRSALRDITFSVNAGEFVLLCGASGCGKSTLLRLLKKELAPYGATHGKIFYRGTPLQALEPYTAAAEIGFVGQNPENGIVTDSVWHELAFGLESLGLSTPEIRRRVAEIAGYFGIEGWFYKKTEELSGGQKQLLHLAAAMVMQPKLLLLDEPTAQLDPIAANRFLDTLHRLNRDLGLTVILAEHRLEDTFAKADRILVLQEGQLQFNGTPTQGGAFFADNIGHPLYAGLPTPLRLHSLLQAKGPAPLTVRQGREYICAHFANRIQALPPTPAPSVTAPILQVEEAWFRYGKSLPDILKGAALTVNQSEHLCILGGNGAGKSTLLRLLAGDLRPHRGRVRLWGKALDKYAPAQLYQNGLALLPQDPQTLFLEKTVESDLQEPCRRRGYTPAQTRQAIDEMAELLGLGHLLQSHPYDLSGGEQQLAALAKVLLGQPKILLLDEPTKGVDAAHKAKLQRILQDLTHKGVTVVTVTHDAEFAAGCAHRCALFFDGNITSVGAPREFFCQNYFYTTAAHRISREYYKNAILCEELARLALQNGPKEAENG